MGLAEDLKALQELHEKGELTDSSYATARDAAIATHAAPSGGFSLGYFVGKNAVVVGIVALVAIIIGIVLFSASKEQTAPPVRRLASVTPPPLPQPHSFSITNGALAVNAGAFSWYTFAVPPNATDVVVNGRFTATGGSGNDIIVYVMDEDAFVNLKNGHASQTFYNSGKITQATINAVLPNAPATYYLVLDNRFSLLTPKAVQITATLQYME